MKATMNTSRLFRGLALGVLLMAGAALYFGFTSGGAKGTGGSEDGVEGSLSSSQILVYEEFDPAELPYDELRESFVGIPASSSEAVQSLPDTPYYRDPDWREDDLAKAEATEALFDEVREAWTGIDSSAIIQFKRIAVV